MISGPAKAAGLINPLCSTLRWYENWVCDKVTDEANQHADKPSMDREAEAEQKQEGCINYNGAEFVEKHRTELISRVSLVEPIADDMRDLIKEEKYTIVLNSGTRQSQMRALLDFLTTPKLKEKLYQSLLEHEHALVNDLENPE